MKKMLDSKFLFIVALSLVVLIILGIGSFYLFDDSDDVFVKSGYVLNPLSSTSEKYFFNENETYKENLSSMVVFKDVDDKNVSILKDSFLHYNDGSLSFLKNGAILDLNTVGNGEAVNFYNITNKSIIQKTGDSYVIANSGNDIKLKNFIGRINENKYIVVGKIQAKIPGNEKNISADYFEIVYTEEGIVNIENKDVKFQVTAEGTIIYVGGIEIDLGAKKISKGGENVMSITAITIDGDENIEIIPEAPEEEDNGSGEGEGTGENGENGTGEGEGGGANGDGEGGTGKENVDINKTEDIVVSLKEASVGSTSVDVMFDIYNNKADDSFTLKVTNLDSGRTVDMVNDIKANEEFRINLLSPNTKYLFTVLNERDGNKYFQKIFETNDFGIKLEKSYSTDSELGFKVIVDKDTDITNAKLSLWKYNVDTKKNEIVTTSYYDANSGTTKYVEKVTYLSNTEGNIEGVHEIVYDGLDSNTIYTAVLDEFSLASTNFKDLYNITLTAMTLKKTPEFKDMKVDKNIGTGSFKLSLGDIEDIDNAIESYTYMIYETSNPDETVIDPIVKSNASPIELKIGDKEGQLSNETNYFYKVVIEWFDNEKYVEYVLDDTINFVMGNDPYVTIVPVGEKISYDTIGATIYLTDNSCLIAMPGREKCDGPSTARVIVSTQGSNGIEYPFNKIVQFDVSEEEIKYDLEVGGLQAGTKYSIRVEAVRSDRESAGPADIAYTDESAQSITTKTFANFQVDWADAGSNDPSAVNLQARFMPEEGTGTLSPEDTAAAIKRIVLKLYNGSNIVNLADQEYIGIKSYVNSDDFNIKEKFYDEGFPITSDKTFGLDLDALRDANDGKLSEYYTVAMYAYYDYNGTREVELFDNVTTYRISPLLLMDNMKDPTIEAVEISKQMSGLQNNLKNSGTTVGYTVGAGFDYGGLVENGMTPLGVNIYVYNSKNEKVDFYIKDGDDLVLVEDHLYEELGEHTGYYNHYRQIFMADGTDYFVTDGVMTRGNSYKIGFDILVQDGEDTLTYPGKVLEDPVEPEKESPIVKTYIHRSTENSITYKYMIEDPDKAVYRESSEANYGLYYKINNGEEHKLDIEKVESNDKYNSFDGTVTITGLSNGDIYSFYYKKNVSKTGILGNDVKPFLDDKDGGKRIFDGYYDASDAKYNFTYDVIKQYDVNNKIIDNNRVIIRINASEDMLDRIVNYELTFTDEANHTPITMNRWKLTKCPKAAEDEIARCLSVNYIDIKSMKTINSGENGQNVITVNVKAFYDNGLTGFDFKVGSTSDKEYKYMILQNNLIPDVESRYITFTKDGSDVDPWGESSDVEKGYYTYNKGTQSITYKSVLQNKSRPIPITLKSYGYDSADGVLNPKMVSVNEMGSTDKTFSFNSITPKIAVGKTTRLINGGIVDLALENADIEDFCEEGNEGGNCINKNNSKFYLYVDVWDSEGKVGDRSSVARPTVKVEINKNNPSATVKAVIDKLNYGRPYYYNVYAFLNMGGKSEYTQLYDAKVTDKYETATYTFSSLSSNELFHSFEASYKPNPEGNYGDKILTTKINLTAYENNVPFNFDLGYAFCELGDSTCGIRDDETNIFKRIIGSDKLSASVSDTVDISEYDLEFNRYYYTYIYVIYEYYDEGVVKTAPYYINRLDYMVELDKLVKPTFMVDREATFVDGQHAFDFKINVIDSDRLLNDGKYYVSLKDSNGNLVGELQILDDDNNYVTVDSNYAFDATEINKRIRITGLNMDSQYTVEVYNDAYINNYDPNVPKENRTERISKPHTIYTLDESGVAFGKDLLFSATEKTFVITFLGGSKFDNVKEVGYTINLHDDQNNTSNGAYGGIFEIGENKKFINDDGEWKFILDDERTNNVLNKTYDVKLSFRILTIDPVTGDEREYYYDSINHPEFAGKAQYVKDNDRNT